MGTGRGGLISSRRNTVACPPSRTAERTYRDVDIRTNLTKELLKIYASLQQRNLVLKHGMEMAKGMYLLQLGGSS